MNHTGKSDLNWGAPLEVKGNNREFVQRSNPIPLTLGDAIGLPPAVKSVPNRNTAQELASIIKDMDSLYKELSLFGKEQGMAMNGISVFQQRLQKVSNNLESAN